MIACVQVGAAERTGVLVIRAWFEAGAGGGLRARITGTLDTSEQDEIVTVCSSEAGVIAAVSEWIDAFVVSAVGVTER